MRETLNNTIHPEGLTEAREDLCFRLLTTGAIKFGNYRMKLHDTNPEAPLSPIYIDLRVLRRFPSSKSVAVSAYEELVKPLEFDLMADVPTAATPLVSTLSDRLNVGMISPRAGAKTHGSGAKIDGLLEEDKGKIVVVIDDLVTGADSKMEAINTLLENGLIVKDVVVLIDRGQGGREQLAAKGYTLHSALTMDQMLRYYERTGLIKSDIYQLTAQRLQALNQFLELNKSV